MDKVVGKLESWADADIGRSNFMRLEDGSNQVRCITSPWQFYIHWSSDATNQNRKVKCALKDCPLCQQGEKAQVRWYVGVLNRKDSKPAIVEMGPQIFNQVLALSKNIKWGDPRGFDLDIQKNPKKTQPLYTVVPEPKEKLTSEEIAICKEFVEKIDLSKMVETPTPESVRERLGLASIKKSSVVVDDVSTSDTEDFNFDNV